MSPGSSFIWSPEFVRWLCAQLLPCHWIEGAIEFKTPSTRPKVEEVSAHSGRPAARRGRAGPVPAVIGCAWPGLGSAWLCLALPGLALAVPGPACPGLAWPWLCLAWPGLALPGLAWLYRLSLAWPGLAQRGQLGLASRPGWTLDCRDNTRVLSYEDIYLYLYATGNILHP